MNPLLWRVTGPVVVISLCLLALGVGSAWYVHRLQDDLSRVLALNVASVRAAEEVEIGIREVQAELNSFLITKDRRHLDAVAPLRRETEQWLDRAEELALTPSEQHLVARVRAGYDRFLQAFDGVERDGDPRTVRALAEEVISKEILPPAHDYLDENEAAAERTSRENRTMAERLVLALGLLGICGAVGGLLAGYGITRGLLRSLVQLQVPVRSAAGKLNEVVGPITLSAGRDLEDLGDALERIAEQVGTVVERLQCSQRELLRGEQLAAVGQLAAGLAHELRNPLMAMKLLVQTAVSRGKGALAGRDLDVLLEEIGRMERWIANFLDFARPPRPEKRDFEVRGVIDQVARLVSPRAESQGVVVRRDGHAEPVVAHADPGQFRQLLLNLMLNALDASPGGGVVRIGLSADEGTGGWMTVQVADSGCGLPDDLGPRIFEPFVSRKETGTGLGLSISKQIVEAHGGTIEAAGGPGGGAVFTARIPLAGVEPAGRSQEASDANPAGGR